MNGIRWVEDPDRIRTQYLKGWFSLDFLSTLPSLCDILPLALGGCVNAVEEDPRPLSLARCLLVRTRVRAARARCITAPPPL